jgi:hypothetical protein
MLKTIETDWSLFLPDPVMPNPRVTIISVGDHFVEPPHMFEGRLPSHLQSRAPAIIETPTSCA